jgi:hypothetical protein
LNLGSPVANQFLKNETITIPESFGKIIKLEDLAFEFKNSYIVAVFNTEVLSNATINLF